MGFFLTELKNCISGCEAHLAGVLAFSSSGGASFLSGFDSASRHWSRTFGVPKTASEYFIGKITTGIVRVYVGLNIVWLTYDNGLGIVE